jgi:hypothetical protein
MSKEWLHKKSEDENVKETEEKIRRKKREYRSKKID